MSSTGAVRTMAASRRLWFGTQLLRPWWPVLVLSAGGLVVMLAWGGMDVAAHADSAPSHAAHAAHATHPGLLAVLLWWGCMTVGMMLPSTLPAMARIRQVVPRRIRPVALSIFVLVFVAAWLPGAVLAEPLMGLSAWPVAGVLAMTAAGLWELTRAKRRALLECRRFPVISAQQPRVHRDVARYGIRRAGTCAVSCGPAMAGVLAAGHPPVLVLLVTAVLVAQNVVMDGPRHRVGCAVALGLGGPVALALV